MVMMYPKMRRLSLDKDTWLAVGGSCVRLSRAETTGPRSVRSISMTPAKTREVAVWLLKVAANCGDAKARAMLEVLGD